MTEDDAVQRFGRLEIRGRTREVFLDDARLPLQDQPRRLLVYLMEHAGELVSRDELRRLLWPDDKFVDVEHGLNTAVKKIRDALHDSASAPRYIETVPRQGYRFLIDRLAGRPAGAIRRRWYLAAVVAGLLLTGLMVLNGASRPSRTAIAVLPLENVSGDPKQQYLADGVTDALITDLGQLPGVVVISRTSVMQYKNTRKAIPVIARELRVAAIIEGSVMASRDRIRVTTRFVDASSARPLWTETRERETSDAMTLEDDVARAIARRIDITVSPAARALPRFNADAEEAYVHGLNESDNYTPEGMSAAIAYFREAIRRDPQYAQAWAGLAEAYNVSMMVRFAPVESTLPLSDAASRRALELDRDLSQAHVARGEVLCLQRMWKRCESEYRRAIALNPNNGNAHQMLGYQLATVERKFPEAIDEMKHAATLDPLSPSKRNAVAAALFSAARYDEALQVLREIPDGDANAVIRHRRRFWIYDHKRLEKRAVAELVAIANLRGDAALAASLATDYRTNGYAACTRAFFLDAARRDAAAGMRARDFAMLGDGDSAFDALEQAVTTHDHSLLQLRVDPFLDNIRNDPRFESLLARVALDDCSVRLGRPAAGNCATAAVMK